MKTNHKNVSGTSGMPTGAHQLHFPWLDQISTTALRKNGRCTRRLAVDGELRPHTHPDLTEQGMDCVVEFYLQKDPSERPEYVYWLGQLIQDLRRELNQKAETRPVG